MKDNKETLSAFEEKAAPKRGALREFAAFYKPHMGMFLLTCSVRSSSRWWISPSPS